LHGHEPQRCENRATRERVTRAWLMRLARNALICLCCMKNTVSIIER
jgi:hypothetical protein